VRAAGTALVVVLVTLISACGEQPVPYDPGHVTLRRLNRTEYRRTVQDLLGTSLDPARDFPVDDHAHGFDNNPDALSLSPLQAELYAAAAETLVDELVGSRAFALLQAEDLQPQVGHRWRDTWWRLWSGQLSTELHVPSAGRYRLSVRAAAENGPVPVRLSLGAAHVDIDLEDALAKVYSVEVDVLEPGSAALALVLIAPSGSGPLRALRVDWLRLEGPLKAASAGHARVFRDGASARDVVHGFASRAFRRPVSKEEVDALMALVEPELEGGAPFEAAVSVALEAVLISPHFLFRVERDGEGRARWLDDWELATRLSYLLWSSMPDETLRERADEGRLHDPKVLSAEVQRMLESPKAQAFIEDFAGQWLATRALGAHETNPDAFPAWSPALRDAMTEQSRRFFAAFLEGARPARELLTADFTYVNAPLAAHYGLSAPGDGFQRISLGDAPARRGLLAQGAFLTFTSYPTRTSPVQRGKWVLSQLLCQAPPPPPPGVEGLPAATQVMGSVRQRLEAHVSKPVCAACHKTMDPMGFALEGFDGIGAARTHDLGYPIDTRASLPDGRSFDGAVELSELVASDPKLTECIAQHLFTYALGRAAGAEEGSLLERVAAGATLPSFIDALVHEPVFRARGAAE